MTVQTLIFGKQKFVVVPHREFQKLQAQAKRQEKQDQQDAGDIAEIQRRKARGPTRPYSELRKKLGFE
jgi:hypothetical protein